MQTLDLGAFTDLGVYTPDEPAAAAEFYRRWGFVVLRDLLPAALLERIETECVAAQQDVLAGTAEPRYGSTKYLDDEGKVEKFVNYVEHVEELAPGVEEALALPALQALVADLLGEGFWRNRNGVVYQDARPGRESGYSRIGWHADWQAVPHLDIWPGTAFTIHVDGTSPANGFLRVVPGSHLWATPSPFENVNGAVVPEGAPAARGYTDTPPPFPMPLGFEKVRGELPVYAERGDVILHDAFLWHSAARATDDATVRRHVRGGWQGGDPGLRDTETGFVKNAAR
ncbi:phytanoyl-CoA dioxygenase family protein [Pseudonocardia sp. NPDC049154]|uniref:phytanoyl-CoA dioxygenase family protein n=1 Tax=Pseudonocardia sp. NPDC049154 TaxID=3155501 RepID=UPI00340E9795